MSPWRTPTLLALAVGALAVGCSNADTPAEPEPTTTTRAPVTTIEGGQPEERTVEITVATGVVGEFLVDGEGHALYVLVDDPPGASTCVDACADAWPPVIGDPVAGVGARALRLETISRDDGMQQVTAAGRPLHRFSGDAAPGETYGHGFNGVWFVADRSGVPLPTPAED
jgi:predicted lipoprotein with Yx(FWY)xxD motif